MLAEVRTPLPNGACPVPIYLQAIYEWFDIAFDKFGRTPTRAQTQIGQASWPQCVPGWACCGWWGRMCPAPATGWHFDACVRACFRLSLLAQWESFTQTCSTQLCSRPPLSPEAQLLATRLPALQDIFRTLQQRGCLVEQTMEQLYSEPLGKFLADR